MRTFVDRIRHTFLFEIIGIAICTPIASWVLNKGLIQIGVLSIVLSLSAMCLNYVFNLVFDLALIRLGKAVNVRPLWMRVLHAILFEASLMVLTIPMVAWWLGMTLWTAFFTDLGFTLFFIVYTFIYNWVYDVIFPMPAEITVEFRNYYNSIHPT